MAKKLTFLHNWWPIITLVFIECTVFLLNYVPGTYLIGWDNLHPEFNPIENIRRSLFGAWVEYRGLGLFDGMSHNANLVHSLLVYLLKHIFAENLIRYIVISGLHLVGGVGLYVLCRHLIKDKFASFIAALFYMFNIGTLQQFFAPFELFIFHYAFLPWIFYTGMKFIEEKSPRNLLLFTFATLLATPQAHVPTIFVAFGLMFTALAFYDFTLNRNILRFIMLGIVVVCVNAFWLLPYTAGVPQNAPIIQNSRINQYSSDAVFQSNIKRGDLANVLQMKGFMLDYVQYDGSQQKDTLLMAHWREHTDAPLYLLFYGIFLGVICAGIYFSFKKKNTALRFLVIPLGISLFFLANNTPIIMQLNQLVRLFPILGEAFRIPFTKFIFILSFAFSLYLGIGIHYLSQKHLPKLLAPLLMGFGIFILCAPVFTGNFYSNLLKRELPGEYKEIFTFFQNEDKNTRVALLPTHLFWSWQHQDWGYGGSGFLWFGIPQPILMRAFDPWSQINEQFYNELAKALRQGEPEPIRLVLAKYNIDYLLVDESFLNNTTPIPEVDTEQLEEVLSKVEVLKEVKSAGRLKVYQVQQKTHKSFVSLMNNPVDVKSNGTLMYEDSAFEQYSNYITTTNASTFLPFNSLFTEKFQSDRRFEAKIENNTVTISTQKGFFSSLDSERQLTISVPATQETYYILARLAIDEGEITFTPLAPQITIDGKVIQSKSNLQPVSFEQANTTQIALNEEQIRVQDGDIVRLKRFEPNEVIFYNGNKKIGEDSFEITAVRNASPQEVPVTVKPGSILAVAYPISRQDEEFTEVIDLRTYEINPLTDDFLEDPSKIKLSSINSKMEFSHEAGLLSHANSYLTIVQGKRVTGLPVIFFVDDPFQRRLITESRIGGQDFDTSVFIIPRQYDFERGYKFHLVTDSINQYPSEFQLEKFSTVQLPYDYLKGILLYEKEQRASIPSRDVSVEHPVPYLYRVKSLDEGAASELAEQYLYLSQGYNNNWNAYIVPTDSPTRVFLPLFSGIKLQNHMLINNWANGWKLPENMANKTIVIVFWPQYLQFVGYVVGIMCFIVIGFVAFPHTRRKNSTDAS